MASPELPPKDTVVMPPTSPLVFTDTQNRILGELDGEGLTAEVLARRLNLSERTIKDAVAALKRAGVIKNKRGLGYYRLDRPPQPDAKS